MQNHVYCNFYIERLVFPMNILKKLPPCHYLLSFSIFCSPPSIQNFFKSPFFEKEEERKLQSKVRGEVLEITNSVRFTVPKERKCQLVRLWCPHCSQRQMPRNALKNYFLGYNSSKVYFVTLSSYRIQRTE